VCCVCQFCTAPTRPFPTLQLKCSSNKRRNLKSQRQTGPLLRAQLLYGGLTAPGVPRGTNPWGPTLPVFCSQGALPNPGASVPVTARPEPAAGTLPPAAPAAPRTHQGHAQGHVCTHTHADVHAHTPADLHARTPAHSHPRVPSPCS